MTKKNKRNMFFYFYYYRVKLFYGLVFLILLSSVFIFSNYFLRRAEAIPFVLPSNLERLAVEGSVIDFYKLDLNNDNIDDFVTLNSYYDGYSSSGRISIILGNEDGTFQNAVNYSNVGLNPIKFVCSDLNNDQNPDIAILDYAESATEFDVFVSLNDGNGGFGTAVNYTFQGTSPEYIIADDFNNDNFNDLAIAARFDSTHDLGVFINDGISGFTLANTLRTMFGYWGKLETADLNNDGYQDIVSNMYYHINNQDNTFTESFFRLDDGDANEIWDFEIGDFNNDNNVDIVFASLSTFNPPIYNSPGGVIVLLGEGNGSFYSEIKYPADINPRSVELGDFNNDNITDFVVGSRDIWGGTGESNLNFYLGDGDGTFSRSQTLTGFTFPEKIFIADINNDHYDDIFYFAGGPFYVLVSNGDGTFFEHGSYNVGSIHKLMFADLNNDNNQDVITSGGWALKFIFGRGNGLLGSPAVYNIAGEPEDLLNVDFNNDTYEDIITVNNTGNNVALLIGKGDGSFLFPKYFSVGNQPRGIVAGDFNNDGKVDAAVTNSADDTVSVLLGDGHDNFTSLTTITTGDKPIGIVSSDFNEDDILDLAVVNNASGTIGIYLGNGDGTFSHLNDLTARLSPRRVVSADFNNDDILDLAVNNADSDNVSVFLGNGDGSFGIKTDYSVGVLPFSIVSDDYNGDGFIDLAVVNSGDIANDSTISILFGFGDGLFDAAINYSVNTSANYLKSYDIVSADINGDGFPDLAVTNNGRSYISPFINQGNGNFIPYNLLNFDIFPKGIVAADFNNDGNNDYAITIVGPNGDAVAIAMNVGLVLSELETNAVFAGTSGFSMELIGSGFDPVVVAKFAGSERTTTFVDEHILKMDILSSDLTNIGIFDINVYNPLYSANSTSLPLNVQGIFVEKNDISLGYAPQYVITADFNSDNKYDLAILDSTNDQLKILNGNGYGGFTSVNMYSTGNNPTKVISADINGDKKLDLLVVNSDSANISIFQGEGNSSFFEIEGSPLITGNNPTSLAVLDINNDNNQDIVVANGGDNNLQLFLRQSDGSFVESENSPIGVGILPVAIKIQDVNNDSKLDLIVANKSSNNLSVLLNNGNGVFSSAVASPIAVGLLPQDLCLKDFNNDKIADIAVVNSGSDNVSILKGDNTGNFTSLGTVSVGQNPLALNCVDYTKDGYNDLAVLNYGDNNISLLLGNGTGSFGLPVSYDTGADPVSMVTNLFNKDTNLDLLTVNATSNDYSVLLGRTLISGGSNLFTFSRSYSQESYPNDFVIDDFNGDDKLDMAVVSLNTGKLSISFGSGSGTFSGKTDYYIADKIASISSGDLDNDGDIDLVMGIQGNPRITTVPNIFIVFNNGDGTFSAPLSFTSYGGMTSVTCGDYNNDGLTDFAATMGYMFGKVVIYLSNGDGTFNTIDLYPGRTSSLGLKNPLYADNADLNNDGNLDLLISQKASLTDDNLILWGNGSGGFTKSTLSNMKGEMVAADLNGDEFLDLVMPTGILLNNRDNTFSTPYVIENFFSGFSGGVYSLGPGVAVGDFNNDSVLDLATTGKDSRTRVGIVKIIMGLGNGRFDMQSQYVVGGSNPVKLKSFDLNSDQRDDLLVMDASSNTVSVLLATIPRSRSSSYRPSAPLNLQCQALDSANIRWSFEDKAWNETGFKLYGPEGMILNLIGEIITNIGYLDEGGLSANSLAADRYVTAYNNQGESDASNKASCYTLANTPKTPIIATITGGLNIAINRDDGNPDYTEYAIFEYYSNKYIQPDGGLSEEAVWAIYDDWGGSEGVDALISENYKIYILARNVDGKISGYNAGSLNLDCQAKSSSEIDWQMSAPSNMESNGFNLYRASSEKAELVATAAASGLPLYNYTEGELQPNTKYSGYFKTYKIEAEQKIESDASNESACYTLANEPLPIIIGEITGDSIQIILDPNDGNPPETLYAILEINSGKYVQADASLGDFPVWQTYLQWGATEGIYVKVIGSVSGEFRISLDTEINADNYNFVAQVKNGDGVVTGEETEDINDPVVLASKGVSVNLVNAQLLSGLGRNASANGAYIQQPVLIRIIQEFSFFLNIILIILVILLIYSLHQAFKNLNIKERLSGKIRILFKILAKKPTAIFDGYTVKNSDGTFLSSYEKYKSLHLYSQKSLQRTAGLILLKVLILIVLSFTFAHMQYRSIALEEGYNQDGQPVKAGDQLSYIISFSNQSSVSANGVKVADILDENVTYLAGSAKLFNDKTEISGSCQFDQNTVNCYVGDLAGWQSGYIVFKALVKASDSEKTIINQAEVIGYNFNSIMTNQVSNVVLPEVSEEETLAEDLEATEEVKTTEETKPVAEAQPMAGAINLPPIAADDTVETSLNQQVAVSVLANDSDPENGLNPGSLGIVENPANGSVSIDLANSTIIYTPNQDYSGSDTFSYRICDNGGQCATALVTVIVKPEEIKVSMTASFFNIFTRDISKTNTGRNITDAISQNKTVKAIAESAPVKFTQDKILNNPVVEQVSRDVVTPTLVTVSVINTVPAVATVTMNFWAYLHFMFLEPLLLIFRKKRKNWGVVYASLTKMPISLALVRLYRKEDKKLVQTRVTDLAGRYLLMIKDPGTYYLEVTKPEYDYPSKLLASDKQDTKYLDLYHGEEIVIKEKDAAVSVNIPLDVREKKVSPIKEVIRNIALKHLRLVISYVGLILAVLVLVIYPSIVTILALLLHIIFYLTFKKLLVPPKTKGWGVVYDAKNKVPLANTVVRIFDLKFNKLLETQVTDKKGRYAFLVSNNIYQLLAEKEGYEKKEIKPVDLVKNEEIVNLDIALTEGK